MGFCAEHTPMDFAGFILHALNTGMKLLSGMVWCAERPRLCGAWRAVTRGARAEWIGLKKEVKNLFFDIQIWAKIR